MTDIVERLRRNTPLILDSDVRIEAAAEIERLREAVKFLNSFRPDAALAQRDAEIERLRGLLREAEQEMEYETTLVWRIREALGDDR